MELLRFNYFADKLNDELEEADFYSDPGSDASSLKIESALLRTVAHFIREKQSTGKQIASISHDLGSVSYGIVRDAVSRIKKRAGTINVVIYGESHKSMADAQRAKQVIDNQGSDKEVILVIERGLTKSQPQRNNIIYETDDTVCKLVNEDELTRSRDTTLEFQRLYNSVFGMGMNIEQRSRVVAAYLTICMENSDPRLIENIHILFGENHLDIFEGIEFFIENVAHNVGKRRRNYFNVTSLG